jgi:hypothetical protein
MKTIIVTCMGRSGSSFLADLVNRSSNATGAHEYLGDKFFQGLSYYSPNHPHLAEQLKENAARMEHKGVQTLVDANPFLRYGLPAIRAAFPDAPVYHLTRNGRKVIASMYQRTSYMPREKKQPIVPFDPSEYTCWQKGSRFEKLCWYWADTIRTLLDAQLPVLRLEDITTDFSILKKIFLQPCGIDLPEARWDAQRNRRVNTNRFHIKYMFRGRPQRLVWDEQKEEQFQTLCGEAMQRLGYR